MISTTMTFRANPSDHLTCSPKHLYGRVIFHRQFYNIEDGYIPCKAGVECGMPNEWFPEFSKPLGPPEGPATTDAERNVWTRTFAHATVSVDLRDRTLSRIKWTPQKRPQED